MGATATLASRAATVQPGSEATAEIRVRNSGTVVDQFTLEVLGDAAAWTIVEPAVIPLFPGAEAVARIRFKPPKSPSVPARAIPYAVRIKSREDAKASMVEEGLVEVGTFYDTFAELIPRTAKGSSRARAQLALDNRGNVRINARLTAADPDRKLNFVISPASLIAEPGTASFATVRLTPRQRFLTGPPKSSPYKLLVHQDGLPTISVDGTMLQQGLLPGWMLPALVGVAALLLIGVILWLAVLRPTIQSAATAAAAPANQTAQNAARVAASAGKKVDQGPQPSIQPAAGGPAWADTLVGNDSILVPAGGSLSVTDLIFENPGARTGGLQLLRLKSNKSKPQTLLSLRLENFRDLDFHFVTPLKFEAGDQLQLACQADNMPDGKPCDASVYYSGSFTNPPGG